MKRILWRSFAASLQYELAKVANQTLNKAIDWITSNVEYCQATTKFENKFLFINWFTLLLQVSFLGVSVSVPSPALDHCSLGCRGLYRLPSVQWQHVLCTNERQSKQWQLLHWSNWLERWKSMLAINRPPEIQWFAQWLLQLTRCWPFFSV